MESNNNNNNNNNRVEGLQVNFGLGLHVTLRDTASGPRRHIGMGGSRDGSGVQTKKHLHTGRQCWHSDRALTTQSAKAA